MTIEDLIPHVAQWLGIDPATALLLFISVITISNTVSRLIPEDQVGWLGTVRKVAKFIGLHVPNRISGKMTTSDAAALVLSDKGVAVGEQRIEKAVDKTATAIEDQITQAVFPGGSDASR